MEVTISPVLDARKHVINTIVQHLDITDREQAEQALRESEQRFRQMFEHNRAVMLLIAPDNGAIAEANPAAAEFYGYPRETLRQMVVEDINALPPDEVKRARQSADEGCREEFIFPHRLASGEIRTVEVRSSPISVEGRRLLFSIIQDITKRKRAEDALRQSEANLQAILESTDDIIVSYDRDIRLLVYNKACSDAFRHHFGVELHAGMRTMDLLPEAQRDVWKANNARALAGESFSIEFSQVRADGSLRLFESIFNPIRRDREVVGFSTFTRDITERKRAEEALRASLEEKVILLKEVHHRVKNNLQIISSLLNLQARRVRSPEFQVFLQDTQNRIRAMALLHETLYGSGNLACVSFRGYVDSVCIHLARSYASDSKKIRIQQDIAEVTLPLDQAIPAGLIINELLSNAFKHAFAGRTEGKINVQLQSADEHLYTLCVADNGVGLPAANTKDSGTLGLRLVESLVQQLEGQLSVERGAETVFQIAFPKQPR